MTNPIEVQPDSDTEAYEEIPWSHLVEELGRPRHNLPLIAAGVLIIGALLGFLFARFAVASSPGTTALDGMTEVATVTPVGEATTPAAALEAQRPEPPPQTTPPPDTAFSEADLMAVATDQDLTVASARAEWFVRDYFTIDGSGDGDEYVARLLAAHGAERPAAVTTYVEWARTLAIQPIAPGDYEVTVAFQLLAADGEAFVRHPARAVTVSVAVDEGLASGVLGLPRPATLATTTVESASIEPTPAPALVLEEATLRALRFGSDPTPIGSWLDRETWHIVMTVQHAGAAWPLLVDVPEPGSPP